MISIYGIPNCGSVKKAIQWAREADVDFVFRNFRTEVPDDALIQGWTRFVPLEKLLNRSSRTWKELDPAVREAALSDSDALIKLLAASPTLIKRPVIVWSDGSVTCGVDKTEWEARKTASQG